MKRWLVALAIVAAAAYVIGQGLNPGKNGTPAHDAYGYFYLNALYALHRLGVGGSGLAWNPFQNCGQPFLAVSGVGLFYPLYAFFLVLPSQTALRVVLFMNLLIGGAGAYGLCRELGMTRVGAVGGTLAFLLGSSAYNVTTWEPMIQGPYVWMPVAVWCAERLMRRPTVRDSLLLGVALGIGLLPGHPQFVLFTCEVVALRLLWGLGDRQERGHIVRAFAGVSLAMVVMLLVAAVQYWPGLEVVGQSLRSGSLRPEEIAPRGNMTWATIAQNIRIHASLAPFAVVPGIMVVAGIVSPTQRRAAWFYLLAGLLFLTLSLGDGTVFGRLYMDTPLGPLFRVPVRFTFVAAFCVAVLVGFAVDVLWRGSWAAVILIVVTLVGLRWWLSGPLWPQDWWLTIALIAAASLSTVSRVRPFAVALILGLIVLAPIVAPFWTTQRYLADDSLFWSHAGVLERVRARATPQDRVHLAATLDDLGFTDKTPQIYELRGISDYEPQMTARYGEYLTVLRSGQLLRSVNQLYYPGPWNTVQARWPLLDLAAVRYLVIDRSLDKPPSNTGHPNLTRIDEDQDLIVYENAGALPRAYYVPHIATVLDPQNRILRLVSGTEDRRRLALVDAAPPSQFWGVEGNSATADATIARDDPEDVVIKVDAPERGFVFLADQYFPGWTATVNGQPTPIMVGNHAFRIVEVPKGPVTVAFHYTPTRVWVGALVSIGSLLAVGVVLLAQRRSRA